MEINKSRPTVPIGFSENVIESAAYLVAALSKLGFNLDWMQTRRDLYVRIHVKIGMHRELFILGKLYWDIEEIVNIINTKKSELKLELVGSWTVLAGDIDQALHLWRYSGGYDSVDRTQVELCKDKAYQQLFKENGNYLRSRYLQYLLAFSYWPPLTKRNGSNIYEIRSYRLQPGTMIEWGNNWAKAINYRRNNNEPFAGFFSQIGYKNLQARMETRESAWRSPGWDECVAYTVPLIRETYSRILSPTSFSPTK
ncbi:hypothetical protein E2986_05867 [Frieseomelitta varia]|uniref:NIPSNAP domain-containing protein n=1 Tax=Frieseomelitta varia TaxID=561572 RepID=A0A833RT92_9HYME|nr:hypothetical protein E2986_05867 [Frieseomelitta varia]